VRDTRQRFLDSRRFLPTTLPLASHLRPSGFWSRVWLAGVWAAARRGFIPDAIDGTRSPLSHSLEIYLRYNQNTLEQAALAAIAWVNLSMALPQERLVLIPAAAFLFGFGRVAFWIGNLINPMARAFGMVLTVLPTIAAYLWLVWRARNR
jgi:hypothetical protein